MQASAKGLKWFQDQRFGMFIHWGLYSILGKQEWVMHSDQIPVPEYEKLAKQFSPKKFNAEEWVSIAADAGQKYMVITSRHHDGFSMYDTALNDYKVTNTPFKRDPIQELANACARRDDVKIGMYSSVLDWHHPAYRFRAESGMAWADYLDFLHGQVRELCTNYGELACLWFDGDWPNHKFTDKEAYFKPGGSFEYDKLYDMVHTLQPDAIVMNNRHDTPLPGEDAQGFEQDLPGANTAGFNATTIHDLPLEVCMTLNDHWGFNKEDRNHKSARYLVHVLARSASVGANYLLNVGPTPEGEILPIHAARLREIGAWLKLNGPSIYAAGAATVAPTQETITTRRGELHYVHVLDYISDWVSLSGVPASIAKARLLHDDTPLAIMRHNGAIMLEIPAEHRDSMDTVIELS